MRIVGRADLIDEPWFADHTGRLEHADELDDAIIRRGSASATRRGARARSRRSTAAIAPDLLDRGHRQGPAVPRAGDDHRGRPPKLGPLQMQNVIPRLDRDAGRIRWPGPELGSSNEAILRDELGLTEEQIADARRDRRRGRRRARRPEEHTRGAHLMPPVFRESDGPGPRRDVVGYGRHVPKVVWPNGARVAVSLVLNYEEGSEYSKVAGDGRNEGLAEIPYVDGARVPRPRGGVGLRVRQPRRRLAPAAPVRRVRRPDARSSPRRSRSSATPRSAQWLREARPRAVLARLALGGAVDCSRARRSASTCSRRSSRSSETCGERPLRLVLPLRPVGQHARAARRGGRLPLRLRRLQRRPAVLHRGRRASATSIVPYSSPTTTGASCCRRASRTRRRSSTSAGAASTSSGTRARTLPEDDVDRPALALGRAGRRARAALREFIEYALEKGDVWFARRIDIANWWIEHHEEFEERA